MGSGAEGHGKMGIRLYGGCIVQSSFSALQEQVCTCSLLQRQRCRSALRAVEVPGLSFQDCVLTKPSLVLILSLTLGLFVVCLSHLGRPRCVDCLARVLILLLMLPLELILYGHVSEPEGK